VGRSATAILVVERQPCDRVEVRSMAAEQEPDDKRDHEGHDEHVADEDEVRHRLLPLVRARPSDCRYAITASSSVLSATASAAPAMSSSVYGWPRRCSARSRAAMLPSASAARSASHG